MPTKLPRKRSPILMDFADSSHIRRLGDDIVNSYLVAESGGVTIVDAGVPGYWKLIPDALQQMGKSLDDVRAILLTHGHSDHIGFAERARRDRGWSVSIHELDAALARGEVSNPATGAGTKLKTGPLDRVPALVGAARRVAPDASWRGVDLRRRRHARCARCAARHPRSRPHTGRARRCSWRPTKRFSSATPWPHTR